ncbi:MAG: hypothetical protein QOH83_1118 [Solirubrobacteraceae bacterium]|nr:hypothetical protein [Solirubrobacteraceae bacterium]
MRGARIALLIATATLLLAAVPAPSAPPDAVTQRPCFGAASRDPLTHCADPSLRLTIFPAPADALLEPNAPCEPDGRTSLLYPCTFGVRRAATGAAAGTLALVGDSHASHWRAAVDVVAARKGVPAVSITRSRCPFINATVIMPRPERISCRRWNREVMAYLTSHREISTLFVSDRSSAQFVTARGKDNLETQVAGYISLWRSLPATILNVVVIRDTPRGSTASTLCVQRAFAARRAAGPRCSRPRAQALHTDPAVVAARRLGSPRVHAIDLSNFFCDPQRCFPVVGGAFVYKDGDHISTVFARTLGPYLLRAYDAILRTSPTANTPSPQLDGLIADERAAAECLVAERQVAAQAGGWPNIGAEHLQRAKVCRTWLELRALQLAALGLSGERNRRNRYVLILEVLTT